MQMAAQLRQLPGRQACACSALQLSTASAFRRTERLLHLQASRSSGDTKECRLLGAATGHLHVTKLCHPGLQKAVLQMLTPRPTRQALPQHQGTQLQKAFCPPPCGSWVLLAPARLRWELQARHSHAMDSAKNRAALPAHARLQLREALRQAQVAGRGRRGHRARRQRQHRRGPRLGPVAADQLRGRHVGALQALGHLDEHLRRQRRHRVGHQRRCAVLERRQGVRERGLQNARAQLSVRQKGAWQGNLGGRSRRQRCWWLAQRLCWDVPQKASRLTHASKPLRTTTHAHTCQMSCVDCPDFTSAGRAAVALAL